MVIQSEVSGEVQKTVGSKYVLTIPENQENMPLLVIMYGAGERGDDLSQIRKSSLVNNIPDEYRTKAAILEPMCRSYSHYEPDDINFLINKICDDYSIDRNRIYLIGYSMGARACWDFATAYPSVPAAIAPFAGFSCYLKAARIATIPTWIFHGEEDCVVPIDESVKMYREMKEYGGKPRLTTFNKVGHGGWDHVYSAKEFYEWLFKQKRKPVN